MQEVEFTSDVVLNLMKGLSDFSAAKLDRAYKDNDDDFIEAKNIEARLNASFVRVASLPAASIKDTIFSRQPVFFSLIIVLDDVSNHVTAKNLNAALLEMDRRFNSDKPISERPKQDALFYEACRASTQRIASRQVRHRYIKRFLS